MTIPGTAAPIGLWAAAAMIAAIVISSTAGEVLTAAAMKSIGDLDEIRAHSGMKGAILAVVTCPLFYGGVCFLALSFFSLLFALNHLNLSLVAPASASLTLVTNAIAGKMFLKENVDRRRWASAILVCIGVYMLAHCRGSDLVMALAILDSLPQSTASSLEASDRD
jgi:drug/metabolite transporter (DMT)-like permease